jgi:hypothetical protein
MGRQTKRKLAPGGVADDEKSLWVKIVQASILQKKVIRATDVGESVGPASALVPHAAVFKIRGRHPFSSQRRTKMPGMIQVVFSAPVAAVNIDDERIKSCGFLCACSQIALRQAQVDRMESDIRKRIAPGFRLSAAAKSARPSHGQSATHYTRS